MNKDKQTYKIIDNAVGDAMLDKAYVTLISKTISYQEYLKLKTAEYDYQNNKEDKYWLFEGRKSYRGEMLDMSNDDLASMVKYITHAKDYRPTPIPGNLSFIMCATIHKGECHIFSLDDNRLSDIQGNAARDFTKYLNNLTKREDIAGAGGSFFYPLVNISMLKDKYGCMVLPLVFITIGCFLQNMILYLTNNNIGSCIHFGVKEYKEWVIENGIYMTPCFLRAGYEKRN